MNFDFLYHKFSDIDLAKLGWLIVIDLCILYVKLFL